MCKLLTSTLGCGLLAWLCSACLAQPAGRPPTQYGHVETSERGRSAEQVAWIKAPWTGDEKPYKRIRLYVDQFIAQGQDPSDLARKYRAQAKDWRDPVAQYRWAYPGYLAEKRLSPDPFTHHSPLLQQLRDALELADLQHPARNYEYARLRFLAQMLDTPDPMLSPIGERLVQLNPQDYEMRYLWAACMNMSPQYAHSKMYMDNLQSLLKAFPKDPRPYMMLAGICHGEIDLKFKNQKAIDKAIAAYRKVQSMSKPDDKFYKAALYQINDIHRMQKWYAAHPNFVGNRMLPDGSMLRPNGEIVRYKR